MGKKWYTSKTLWLNVIGIVWILFAESLGLPTLTTEIEAIILAGLNAILRAITKEPIVWTNGKTNGGTATGMVAIFLLSSLAIPSVAAGQAYESKELWEPDYTVGLFAIRPNLVGEGVEVAPVFGVGLGLAYSSVTSTGIPQAGGEVEWDYTNWSVAIDPIYFERDVNGSLYWVPGVKGTVFNEYLQLYLGYKVGNIETPAEVTFWDRFYPRFGTNLVGIAEFLGTTVGTEDN